MDMRDLIPDSSLVSRVHPAVNHEARRGGAVPDILLLHYTGTPTVEFAIELLTSAMPGVSCHYVIDEAGGIIQLVPEALRAWHAGVSHWHGVTDINSCSIGIEIQNPGHDGGYSDFPEAQMRAVEALSLDIIRRHRIRPERVLAHSDVAPKRKIGEKFDWGRLAAAGIGHWALEAPFRSGPVLSMGMAGLGVIRLQEQLRTYGYGVEATGLFDEDTKLVVQAFQRHFRPTLVDGIADISTLETLDALLAALPQA
jgi:N-acetylmuramoyl-L-alanine amidase